MNKLFVSFPLFVLLVLGIGVSGYAEALKPEAIKNKTNSQLLEEAESAVKMMQDIVKKTLDRYKKARDENDIGQMKCINENLQSLKGYLKLSEQNFVSLREKDTMQDRAGAENEYVKIMLALEKMEELDARVKGCGGPSAEGIIEGKPVVSKDFDDDLPEEDPEFALEMLGIVIDTPESSSPLF